MTPAELVPKRTNYWFLPHKDDVFTAFLYFNMKIYRYSKGSSILPTSCNQGFTLVEILVTILVLTFGCFAALMMQSAALRGSTKADHLTVATFVAETEMERLKAMTFQDLTALIQKSHKTVKKVNRILKVCEGKDAPKCVNYPYTIETTFYPRFPTNYSHQAEVNVTWNDNLGKHSVTYSASMTDLAL
jgi:prepilin-type N-terminal cleavage/methylation domain-containing protein